MFRLRLMFLAIAATVSSAAAPLTLDRIQTLPATDQAGWAAYWERSQTKAQQDRTALQQELNALRLTLARRAPSGGDFKLPAPPSDPYYGSTAAAQLADTILSYQTPSGGWSKHTGYSKGPREPGTQWTSQNEPGQKPHYVATFDNRATTEEMYFLAQVWFATQREDCKAGFIKGLNFILAAQYPNGGWPQVYPLEGGYHDDITFNDGAMTRILELLHAIKSGEAYYAFLDESLRQKVSVALDEGIRCVLKTQIAVAGKKTVWCAQYDPLTLQPAAARAMEPVTLSGLESADILSFLMRLTNPPPEIVGSIESGLAWLQAAQITGLTRTKQDGKTYYDPDPTSTQVFWARFYNLTNGRPVFPGRDGVLYDSFNEMAAKNKVGYDYYSTLPGSVVNNGQKKWRKLLTGQPSK